MKKIKNDTKSFVAPGLIGIIVFIIFMMNLKSLAEGLQ